MRTAELVEYFGVCNSQTGDFFFLSISTDRNGEFEKQMCCFGLADSMKGVALLGGSVFCLQYHVEVSEQWLRLKWKKFLLL